MFDRRVFERQEPSSETWGEQSVELRLRARISELSKVVHKELERQGFSDDRIEIHPFLNMRQVTESGIPLNYIAHA